MMRTGKLTRQLINTERQSPARIRWRLGLPFVMATSAYIQRAEASASW